ncbi:hypothetical protein ABAC460_12605 [Asticcacaulis sp. AC460]|uniref:hypothetical protein n=1 Tax=Asticcacaulis sp. AC460 TaxID=1282360 RepID=UPI0003C3DE03|nr:hypothetical protein [Asticcacaulis sp. AC460]ESQ89701.1 hypothetical protein ABAC460_12605 [Asticcacaulis sp. AC460]
MTDFLQQAWFPITAMLAVLTFLVLALNQRDRQRRRDALRSRPIIVTPAQVDRDDDRLG